MPSATCSPQESKLISTHSVRAVCSVNVTAFIPLSDPVKVTGKHTCVYMCVCVCVRWWLTSITSHTFCSRQPSRGGGLSPPRPFTQRDGHAAWDYTSLPSSFMFLVFFFVCLFYENGPKKPKREGSHPGARSARMDIQTDSHGLT